MTRHTISRYHLALIVMYATGLIFGLLSLIGAFDYVMTFTHNQWYFEYLDYGQEQIEYFASYPIGLTILLTLGVWGTVAGSILLLCRSRWAIWAYGVAAASQIVLDILTFSARDRWDILGPKLGSQDLVVLVLTLAMLRYALHLRKSKLLK